MPTFADMITRAEAAATHAKADAARARLSGDQQAIDAATEVARAAGREVALWQFNHAVDQLQRSWQAITRPAESDPYTPHELAAAGGPDSLLRALAPRTPSGDEDWDWVAAATLKRAGMTVPNEWRSSETGDPFNDHLNDREPRGPAGPQKRN